MVLIENNSSSMANIKNFLPHKIFYILTFRSLSWCSKLLGNKYNFDCIGSLDGNSVTTLVMKYFSVFEPRMT
jgi:hypothetical protein